MGKEEEQPDRFRIGQLVVISVASKGIATSIPGDFAHTDSKLFWIFHQEYLIGIVVGVADHPDFPLSYLWKILTVEGIAHIWDEDIAEDDLSVELLTESIGEWLGENCIYDYDTGKYTLTKDLVATRSYSSVTPTPQVTVNLTWKVQYE